MEYREAWAIALYDSNTIIRLGKLEHPFHLIGGENMNPFSIMVSSQAVCKIAEQLGLDTFEDKNSNDETLLYREFEYYADNEGHGNVTKILACIQDGLLHIKTFETYGSKETEFSDYEEAFSYSGKFSIHWK